MSELEKYQKIGQELNDKEPEQVEILKLAEAAERKSQDVSNKISSGFSDIDNCMDGGFREGDVTVITGIEGEGKTTLARMFTLNFAEKEIPTLWFSFEMTYPELWDSFKKMGADTSLISYVPIELESEVDWLFVQAQKAIEEKQIKAVFIDTIADVSLADKRRKDAPNYATVIDMLCKDIRAFAIKHEIMFFEIAHATKNTKSRSNETENSDIANSAGIKNTATNIFHVWRDKETDNLSYVKIGKSRRDGTKKDWKFKFRFTDYKLLPEGRHSNEEEEAWKSF